MTIEDLTVSRIASAWDRVAANAGGPGVDGIRIEDFRQHAGALLPDLLEHAIAGTYRALPLRRLEVQKHAGSPETRILQVPTVADRVLQTAVARLLSRSFEEEFLEASYAYRPGRGVDRAISRILQLRDRGYRCVVDADILGYFDRIGHGILLERLTAEPDIDSSTFLLLKQWIEGVTWDGHTVQPLRRGIPMGSPISPLLANLFLTPLDIELNKGDQKLIRYSDDFVILCRTPEAARAAHDLACAKLNALGLELKWRKTRITDFEEGFRFLGVHFHGEEAMTPWKYAHAHQRVVFVARRMTAKELRPYRLPAAAPHLAVHPPHPQNQPDIPPNRKETLDDMAYLYVTQPGAVLRKSGDRFLVEFDGEITLDIPYHRLEHILIFGNAQITSQAMAEALEHGIAMSLFSRNGRLRGGLTPPSGKNVLLRLAQYALHQDAERSLAASRECIRWKLENSLTVLERYEARASLGTEPAARIEAAERNIENIQGKLDEAPAVSAVLGYEGAGAKAYFAALQEFNKSDFIWSGRQHHPARDPLNALLSLTYTLIMNEFSALVQSHGLDPSIGFLHEIDGERPSLSLDLLEPFRAPVADRFVWTVVNRSQFSNADFEQHDEHSGLYLRPAALRRFFESYESWMASPVGPRTEGKARTFRNSLGVEVAGFLAFLRSGGTWTPFSFPGMLE